MTERSKTEGDTPELDFSSDPGASRSIWIAAAILVLLVAWMGSGFVLPSEQETSRQDTPEPKTPSVMVRDSEAELVTLTFSAEGQALPDRDTSIRAEASGNVVELLARMGEMVSAGKMIARLSSTRAEADLARAEEELVRAQRQFDNAQELQERGVATADLVFEARAARAAATSQVTQAEEALENLAIVAPFDGRIETLTLNRGEFISA